jgi:hypothetical protein
VEGLLEESRILCPEPIDAPAVPAVNGDSPVISPPCCAKAGDVAKAMIIIGLYISTF